MKRIIELLFKNGKDEIIDIYTTDLRPLNITEAERVRDAEYNSRCNYSNDGGDDSVPVGKRVL